jgi:hypothetical protein
MKIPGIMSVLVLAGTMASVVYSAEIQVLPVQGAGISTELQNTAQSLVRMSVTNAGYTCDTVAYHMQLKVTLVRLEQTVIVSAEKIDNGKSIFTTRLKAATVDELDVVIGRAVSGAINGIAATDNEEIGKVTQTETKEMETRKDVQTYHLFDAGFSAYHGMAIKHINLAYALQGGLIWEVGQHFAPLATIGGSFLSAEFGCDFEMLIGARWLFSMGRNSPYAGAGFGYGLASSHDNIWTTISGLTGNLNAGCILFRTSKVQADVGLQYTIIKDDRGNRPPVGRFSIICGANFGTNKSR